MSPGATATTAPVAASEADLVILAVPLSKYRNLPAHALAGKIVIDAMNYWPGTDGTPAEFEEGVSSAEIIQSFLSESRIVKTFSYLGYHQIDEDVRPAGAPDRHALAIAGDDEHAVRAVTDLVDRMGFGPVLAGPLANGVRFAPGIAAFGVSTDREHLWELLGLSDAGEAPGLQIMPAFHGSDEMI